MKPIILAGPTASGKTAVGVLLAQRLNGEVISCDSMQIYREIPICSAQPTPEERQGVPHHLMGCVPFDRRFTVVDWRQEAMEHIKRLQQQGKTPILVGGTGLYVHSLLYQTDFASQRRDDVKAQWEQKTNGELYAALLALDPGCRLHENDRKRMLRFLEVYTVTGALPEQDKWKQENPLFEAHLFCLSPEREALYERIDRRVDQMLEKGLPQEVEALDAAGVTEEHACYKAIGVRQWLSYIHGEQTRDEAVEQIKRDSRHYAKRQLTWMRGEKAYWLKSQTTADRAEEIIKEVTT